MNETNIYLTYFAIIISVISLFVSMYRIYRDRSKLYAYSNISYDHSKSLDNPPPVLSIYAVNIGTRPITLTDFGLYVSRKKFSWSPLKPEPIKTNSNGAIIKFPSNLAHNIGIKMEDGDIYEIRIYHDDYRELYDTNLEAEANKYFFKDVLGNKYFIKGSKKGIKILLNYKA